MSDETRSALRRRVTVVLLTLGAAAFGAGPVWAHGSEANVPAKALVQEAIDIIQTPPEQMDAIADKLNDAIDSSDSAGVDIGAVRQAQTALRSGDIGQTEFLLERSLGNGGTPSPNPVLRAFDARPIGGGKGIALVGLAVLFAAAGSVLLRRSR